MQLNIQRLCNSLFHKFMLFICFGNIDADQCTQTSSWEFCTKPCWNAVFVTVARVMPVKEFRIIRYCSKYLTNQWLFKNAKICRWRRLKTFSFSFLIDQVKKKLKLLSLKQNNTEASTVYWQYVVATKTFYVLNLRSFSPSESFKKRTQCRQYCAYCKAEETPILPANSTSNFRRIPRFESRRAGFDMLVSSGHGIVISKPWFTAGKTKRTIISLKLKLMTH